MGRKSVVACVLIGVLIALSVPSLGETSFSLMTWNLRGYPEATRMERVWFTDSIEDHVPTILCIQEIADTQDVNAFVDTEYVAAAAFTESSSEFDNAIFIDSAFTLWNETDPNGFVQPAQLIVLLIDGQPYYILTVHLADTDTALRATARALLTEIVDGLRSMSQFVIVAGTFYTTGKPGDTIEELSADLQLDWLQPKNYGEVGTKYTEERYDHILVSPTISESWVIETEIIEFDFLDVATKVSDHRPVLAEFSPIPPPEIPEEEPEEEEGEPD